MTTEANGKTVKLKCQPLVIEWNPVQAHVDGSVPFQWGSCTLNPQFISQIQLVIESGRKQLFNISTAVCMALIHCFVHSALQLICVFVQDIYILHFKNNFSMNVFYFRWIVIEMLF